MYAHLASHLETCHRFVIDGEPQLVARRRANKLNESLLARAHAMRPRNLCLISLPDFINSQMQLRIIRTANPRTLRYRCRSDKQRISLYVTSEIAYLSFFNNSNHRRKTTKIQALT